MPAETRIDLEPHGNLVFYGTKLQFVAECKQVGHHRCFKSRTAVEGRRSAQGRPLGHLAAWLRHGDCEDQQSHLQYQPSLEERHLARRELKAIAGADALFAQERSARTGEDSEPEQLA